MFKIKEHLPGESPAFYSDFDSMDLSQFQLIYDDVLKLNYPSLNLKNIYCDIQGQVSYHEKFFSKNSIYKDNLAKAIGLKKGKPIDQVVDLTAGLLGDSIILTNFCKKVVAYERNPLIYALSKSALRLCDIAIELRYGEFEGTGEILYFDPMYEDPNKKTAPKKEMQFFRHLLTKNSDAQEFLKKLKWDRLVIKRPIKSQEILSNIDIQFKGKSTRYDVYLKAASN